MRRPLESPPGALSGNKALRLSQEGSACKSLKIKRVLNFKKVDDWPEFMYG